MFVLLGLDSVTSQTSWTPPVTQDGASRTARWLMEGILGGRLQAGSRLPSERQLSTWSGLSRPAVREALRGLAARGYLDVVLGSGAYVRDVSVIDVAKPLERLYWRRSTPREVMEARRMLESQAAVLAATRAGEADLAAMKAAIARFERADDPLVRARHDLAFISPSSGPRTTQSWKRCSRRSAGPRSS